MNLFTFCIAKVVCKYMQDFLTRLQLRHFRLIHAIAEYGQLSLAADRLAITQPAASRTLSEVERLVGAAVFERHPKGMTPTQIGEALIRHSGILLHGLDQAASELSAYRAGRSGSVRVGAVTGAAVGFVVPAIQALKRETHDAHVRVDVDPSVDLMTGLLNREYDFVLSRVPPGYDTQELQVLQGRVEHLEILVRSGHPLLREKGLGLAALRDYPWVLQSPGMPIREAIVQAHLSLGQTPPQDVIDSTSLLVMMAYLRTSDAISPAAREVAELVKGSDSAGFSSLDLRSKFTMSPYHLIQLKGRKLNPIAERLLNLVQAILSHPDRQS